MSDFSSSLYETEQAISSIDGILSGSIGIVWSIIIIVGAIVSFCISVTHWLLQAYPLFRLAQKIGRKNAWLAWIPGIGDYCRTFVLTDLPGNKEVVILNKVKLSRVAAFWIWVGVKLFGFIVWDGIMTIFSGIASATGIGALLAPAFVVLSFVPDVALFLFEYTFLRDALDLFKPDKKKNNTMAIILSVVDYFLPWRFARTVYLWFLLRCEPLPGDTDATPIDSEIVQNT